MSNAGKYKTNFFSFPFLWRFWAGNSKKIEKDEANETYPITRNILIAVYMELFYYPISCYVFHHLFLILLLTIIIIGELTSLLDQAAYKNHCASKKH